MRKLVLLFFAIVFCGLTMTAQVLNEESVFSNKKLSRLERKIAFTEHQKLLKSQPLAEKYLRDSSITYLWNEFNNNWDNIPDTKTILKYNLQGLNTQNNGYLWEQTTNKWVDSYEYRFVYDINGNITEWIYNDYDITTQTWIPYEHDTLIYNNNILISESWYIYNTLNNTWFKGASFKYNNSGAQTEYYYLDWNYLTFAIEGGDKEFYTLNSKDRPIESINQSFDTLTQSWVNFMKTESTYQNDTTLVSELIYMWNGSGASWDLSYQNLYTYTDNLKTEILSQGWDGTLWTDSWRRTYEYNSNKYVTKDLYQTWNGANWYNLTQTLYTYYSNNLTTEKLYQNFVNNEWVNSRSYGYTFDNNNNQTEFVYKRWDASTGLLTSSSYKYSYTHDANNLNTETIYQRWNTTNVDWLNNSKTNNYYSLHTIYHVFEVNPGLFKIYPNPANTTLFVTGLAEKSRVSIYDLTGKLLFNDQISNHQIDISIFQCGIYTIKIENSTGIFARKFIKQ